MARTASIDMAGDVLTVEWTGSVWVAPCCGNQHAREWDALAVELEHYLRSCGEDVTVTGEQVKTNFRIDRN